MPGPNLRIRAATAADIDALLVLLEELFSVEADFTFDAPKQRQGLSMLLERSADSHVLVAEFERRVVGMCSVQVLVSTAEGGRVGLIEDMVVRRESRGRGVGRNLLAAMEQWCVEHGLKRLQLLADRTNLPALRFYAKQGWSSTRLICLRKGREAG